MIAKTIKYVNFNGENKEKTYYFHMNRIEFMELETSVKGGWLENLQKKSEMVKKAVDEEEANKKKLEAGETIPEGTGLASIDTVSVSAEFFDLIKDLVLRCVGEKSEDGEDFVKDEALKKKFAHSEALAILLEEFFAKPESLSEFIQKAIPSAGAKELPAPSNN